MAASDDLKKVLWQKRKEILQAVCLFCIINMLFLSAVSSVGLQVFIDTFKNHESYVFIENHCLDSEEELLIVMSQNHPDFSKEKNLTLLRIKATDKQQTHNSVSTQSNGLGGVVGSMNDDVLSKIVFWLWETSTETLNVFSLFP